MKPPASENLTPVYEPVQHIQGWSPSPVQVKGKFSFDLPGAHITHRIQRCLPCAQLLSAADHSSPFSGLSKMSQRNHFASNHGRTSGHGQWPIVKQSACSGSQPSLTRQWVVGDLTAHALPGNSYSTDTYLFGCPWWVSRAQAEPVLLPEEKR